MSLIGIFSGFIVLFGMFRARRLNGWTAFFLATTVLTSVTGFFFPRDHLLSSHVVGILSLVVLVVAPLALYVYRLAGSWRWIYVVGAVVALYFNVFVGVVQAFLKVPRLNALAPTQSEPPFYADRGAGDLRCARHRGGKIVSPRDQVTRVPIGELARQYRFMMDMSP